LCAGSNHATEAFNGRQRWTDDAARPKFFEYGGHQRWPIVGGKRRWQQPNRNFPIHRAGQGPKPKSSLNLKNVFPASLISFGVIAKVHWIEAQLLSDKNTQCRGWLLALLEDPSWKSQVTKHHGEAKTIGIAAVPIDQGDVLGA
jgi:hypothetical protein